MMPCIAGQALDGPMGISMAVSPSTNTVTVSKSMITNASFRTKKLPGMSLECVKIGHFFNCNMIGISFINSASLLYLIFKCVR